MLKYIKTLYVILFLVLSNSILAQNGEVSLVFDTSGYQKDQNNQRAFSTPMTKDNTIASIKGEGTVGSTGGFNYVVPIDVVQGVNDFQPNLSIVYNSHSGNGVAGWGWNISGLSIISVGSKSKELDDSNRPVQYDGKDPYYLDGARLLSGDGVNFKTLLYSEIKIQKVNKDDFSFIVYYPNGKIAKYKTLSSDSGEALRETHMISEMSDANGNKIQYEYFIETDNIYLSKITYGHSTARNCIKFNYKNRKVSQAKYQRGRTAFNKKVLSDIVVCTPGNENGVYKKYNLTYDFIHQNTIERLIKIEVQNSRGELLNPLRFTYTTDKSKGVLDYKYEGFSYLNDIRGIGDIVVGDFMATGKLTPVYEIEVLNAYKSNKPRLIKLWNTGKGEVEKYENQNKRLYSGKALVNKTVDNKTERIISHGDLLLTLKSDYSKNDRDEYVLSFYDLSGTSNYKDQSYVKFSLPGIIVENDYTYVNVPEKDWQGKPTAWTKKEKKYSSKDIEYPHNTLKSTNIRDKKHRKILLADFNNDGLVDLLIFSPKGVDKNSRATFHFYEIGKIERHQQQIELKELKYNSDVKFEEDTNVYPIDFDGDGLADFMTVTDKGELQMLKLDSENLSISKIYIGIDKLDNFTKKTPIIFGDFNGDGLTDFIVPDKVYDLDKSDAKSELTKMSRDKLEWWSYISTGKQLIKEKKDFTEQKLAYITPSQHHDIKRSSGWDKFWSGTPDKYRGTEYGTSNIMAIDVNGDGVTDLVSFRKFGKLRYEENLTRTKYDKDIGFESPLKERDGIQFYIVNSTSNGDFKVSSSPVRNEKGEAGFSLATTNISPFSLILNKSDFNSLNAYKNGIIIHDPIERREIHYTIDNDGFVEGQLSAVDNGAGSVLNVEYRPMSEDNNTKDEKIYTFSNLNLPYPYYVHKSNGGFRLVHKIHSLTSDKILTKEYRYHNGIQHLQGKGFIGFQQTKSSETYESELKSDGKYRIKDFSKGMFWRINTYDPLMDNVQISATYGSLSEKALFSKSTVINKRYDKGNKSYIIVPIQEIMYDYLNGFETSKTNWYESGASTFYLTKAETNYYSPSLNGSSRTLSGSKIEEFSYLPKFTDSESGAMFYGLFSEVKTTSRRGNDSFSSKEVFKYNTKGAISSSQKYGNGTAAITTEYEYYNFGGIEKEKVFTAGIAPLVTSYGYDDSKRFIIRTVAPDGLVSTSVVDTYGKVLSSTDGLGRSTKFNYDSWDNVTTVTDYLGNKVVTTRSNSTAKGGKYDVTVTGADGSVSIISYDVLDRVIQTRVKTLNNKWSTTRTEYDVFGNVVRSSQPYYEGENVKWNSTVYDRLQRPVLIVDYKGREFKTCYEKNKVTVEDGHKKMSKWVDAQGYVIKTQDQGGVILNTYYANGSLKEANYDGIRTSISIDGWGNKTQLVDPSAGTYTYVYDNLSRLLKTTTPNGGQTTYIYDELGRTKEEKTVGGKEENTNIAIKYSYDKRTKLPNSVSGNYNGQQFSYTTNYDKYGRVLGKIENTPKFIYSNTYLYDQLGRVDEVNISTALKDSGVTSSSKVVNVYDSSGILKMQKDGRGGNAITIWDIQDVMANGSAKKVAYGNGFNVENSYSPNEYLSNIRHSRSGHSLVDIGYNYNEKRGTLSTRNDKVFGKNESYTYDDLDRLLTESTNGTLVNEYTYDPRGRITSNTEVGKYNYNSSDYRLQSINFNDKGSKLVQDRGFAVVKYNMFKSPNEVYLEKKGRINYEFSILKSRYAAYFGSTDEKSKQPIQKYYSADKTIEIVVTKDKTQIITYVTGDPYSANYIKIDEVKGTSINNSKGYYLHRDNQGSIVAISDNNGNNIEQRYFDAWGNLKGAKVKGVNQTINELGWTAALLIDRGYTGHEHLYTVGLIHMNGRIYDPALRRFLSPDNYVQDNTSTQSYNRYGYVLNNPLLYTDPSGEFIPLVTAIVVGVAIAVGTTAIINIANGVPFWYGMGKSAAMGALSGAISFGIGSAVSSLTSTASFFAQAGMHGVSGGLMSELDGGKFISGFASGAISSMLSSGIGKLGPKTDANGNIIKEGVLSASDTKAMMIVGGGLSGGISSSIAGGDFMKGMQQGLITSGLNHAMHEATSGWDQDKEKSLTDKLREVCDNASAWAQGVSDNLTQGNKEWDLAMAPVRDNFYSQTKPLFELYGSVGGFSAGTSSFLRTGALSHPVSNVYRYAASSEYGKVRGLGVTRTSIKGWLANVGNLDRVDLIRDIERIGFRKIYEGQGMTKYGHGKLQIRIDPPQGKTNYNHMHLNYGGDKKAYNINLQPVNFRSTEAHIRIK
ncbi:RHS repeat-associated core domain-containing protein [Myroides odoratimimus]|uniref:RHS repeat-associated core domain-containing protein n=1 Tax=Myroides odoratimimus TaxID=76832 RepID=UPI0004A808B3|nr:RHS repeat-associated core domain-containing protein [Myroides odoratimimus]